VILASIAAVILAGAPAPSPSPAKVDACSAPALLAQYPDLKKYPKLIALVGDAAKFREDAKRPEASFSALVARGRALAARMSAPENGPEPCGLPGDVAALDACLEPIQYGCEAVPATIRWSFLDPVLRAPDEEIAYSLDGLVLDGSKDLLAVCCGDFGCAPGGVGLPAALSGTGGFISLTRLAEMNTPLGRDAFAALTASADAAATPKCGCFASDVAVGAVSAEDAARATRDDDHGKAERRALKALVHRLRHPPPVTCKLPGYND
jgi:hypothetical protein